MTLRLTSISKQFGSATALRDVSLTAASGEIHALLGENGAGKSTLMHIAYGMLHPDAGTISFAAPGGREITVPGFGSPRAARAAGIGMVHQHFTSIPAFTVAENIALTAGWSDTGRAAERRASELVEQLGLELPVTAHVDQLSVQLRQRLEIVKALATEASVLLLDEPTAVLAPPEIDELLAFTRSFAERGGTVVLITHKLDEVFRAADRVTVLRRGAVTLTERLSGQTPQSLSRAMIGSELMRTRARPAERGDIVVQGTDVQLRAGRAAASFALRAGEIIGVAAVEGNGERELLRAIAAVPGGTIAAGVLEVTGPVAFIPEDRTTEGTIGTFTLVENLLLGTLDRAPHWLDWRALRDRTTQLMQTHDVRAESADVAMSTLSGGNQQKFVFGRALEGNPRVIVAENPSRGLDVQATQAIHDGLRAAARNGTLVILHSSDLDEVVELGERLFVVARSELRELPVNTSRDAIGEAMLAVGIGW